MAITPISEKALEETTLTPREQLIISRVRDGWTNKEIADELTTIKKHLTELYKKFHVHSRTQLLLEIDKSQK
jgi:DNA-binding NarL/FixJ family response regulator